MKANWTKVNQGRPPLKSNGETEPVWTYSMSLGTITVGYYSKSMNSWFDQQGNGIRVSHWTPIITPEPPEH